MHTCRLRSAAMKGPSNIRNTRKHPTPRTTISSSSRLIPDAVICIQLELRSLQSITLMSLPHRHMTCTLVSEPSVREGAPNRVLAPLLTSWPRTTIGRRQSPPKLLDHILVGRKSSRTDIVPKLERRGASVRRQARTRTVAIQDPELSRQLPDQRIPRLRQPTQVMATIAAIVNQWTQRHMSHTR